MRFSLPYHQFTLGQRSIRKCDATAARIAPQRLANICASDQWNTMFWSLSPAWAIIAVGRLMVDQAQLQGETAMVVADQWQRSHLGRAMKEVLIQAAYADAESIRSTPL